MRKLFVLLLFLFFLSTGRALAQINADSLGIAHHIDVEGQVIDDFKDGMIISHQGGSYRLSGEAYDKGIFGVVTKTPAFEFTLGESDNSIPILSTGTVPVLVSASNGSISKGSLITTSGKSGIGMLSTKTGFTLGIAQEEFRPEDSEQMGKILVTIDIKFSFNEDAPDSEKISRRLLDVVSLSALAAIDDPMTTLKYVVSSVVLISSIIFSLLTSSRVAQKGIDALGRNPLASKEIHFGIILNVLVSVVIIGAGIALSYLIININILQ